MTRVKCFGEIISDFSDSFSENGNIGISFLTKTG